MQEKMRFHIESEQPGRNEAMNEWLDEHRAIFTALDENFPTPEEITSEEVLMLPEIQSMSAYIRQHFEEEIVAEVSRKIRHGELSVICGCSQREELVFAGAKDLFPRKGRITWIDFRRTEDYCVEADLTLEIEIEIQLDRSRQVVRQRYRADMWLDLEEDIDIEYGNIRLYRREGEKKGIKLDEYLIPVFRWDDIEEEAERIIQWINPEGLSDPAQLQPDLFADRLGLRVIQLPLYNRPQTESILFFGSGTVQVAINGECTNEEWMLVPVAANTIVLNTIPGREKNAIFHECFHYVEHQLFYQLQRMHNNDVSRLAQWRPVRLEKNKRSPIEWLEWQAHVGSQCLQMPRSLLRQRIQEELDVMQGWQRHMGYKLQTVGRSLAKEFGVYNYQLRNRMIHVGYGAARGALNFVNDGYIEPFAFALCECHGSQTFVISPKEMLETYVRDEAFRELIDTGRYVYVDGHICVNSPQYVNAHGEKLQLTAWANEHVDQCCLRFVRTYHRNPQTHYIYGQLNSDEEYNGRSLTMSATEMSSALSIQAVHISKLLLALPATFHETFTVLMDAMGITVGELSEATMISERSITRYRSEERVRYSADTIAVLCIGMHLDPILSMELLDKAGITLKKTPEDLILKAVLMGVYTQSVAEVRKYLEEIQYARVGLWPKQE